ncbi:MAG: hypothetical protein RLN72_01185 [Henriciella sp.]
MRRKTTGLNPLTWSIFTVLVLSLFFKRVVDIWGTVTPRDCDELPVNLMGPGPGLDGPMDWILIIGAAAFALLIIQAVDTFLSRAASRTLWLLWSVNSAMCAMLVWSFLLAWAYFNPDAPQARPIFQFTAMFQPHQSYVTPYPVADREPADEGDWIWNVESQSWRNESIGLIRRLEVVRFCNQPERVRAQLRLIYGDRTAHGLLIDELDQDYLQAPQTGYVLYDLDDNYLPTLGGPWEQTSTLTRSRDAAYDPEKAAMSPEEAERRFFAWIKSYYAPRPEPYAPPLILSREEIDQIVAESWGDERPSWHEDEADRP